MAIEIEADTITAAAARETRPPVVLQVLPSLVTGGVERGTVEVAAALAREGWRSLVASSGGPMVRLLDRCGASHFTLPVDSKNPVTMRRNVERLADLIVAHDVDVVHARSRAPAWSARAAARRTGRRFVTTFHSTYSRGNFLKRRYNAVMTSGDRVIANSDFIADHIRAHYGIDDHRLVTIHRGVDFDHFDPANVSAERIVKLAREWRLPDGVPVVMLAGRLVRRKGHALLIEALARLGRDDILCLLVGAAAERSGYRRELEEMIERMDLAGTVRIVGGCDDMAAAYMVADVVVIPSTTPEAFGRVAAEAQAMGRPVIAADAGAARETVVEGETGWLVPPHDAGALAGALAEALALDGRQREVVAAAARTHVAERFTVERMCRLTLDTYAAVLAEA